MSFFVRLECRKQTQERYFSEHKKKAVWCRGVVGEPGLQALLPGPLYPYKSLSHIPIKAAGGKAIPARRQDHGAAVLSGV